MLGELVEVCTKLGVFLSSGSDSVEEGMFDAGTEERMQYVILTDSDACSYCLRYVLQDCLSLVVFHLSG